MCRESQVPVHCDAVQAVGKIPVDFGDLGVDALSFSAHKFHGPAGIGGLLVRHDVSLSPILFGGFQQGGLRPGTEPVPLVIGLWKALDLWSRERHDRAARLMRLRDELARRLRVGFPNLVVNGDGADRLPHTLNVAFPGVDRQALVMALDMVGVACSTGSACASGSSERSPVLLAMGAAEGVVDSSIRLTLSAFTTESEVELGSLRILNVLKDLQNRFSARSAPVPPRVGAAKPI
jgi:cysteine desulfurase